MWYGEMVPQVRVASSDTCAVFSNLSLRSLFQPFSFIAVITYLLA